MLCPLCAFLCLQNHYDFSYTFCDFSLLCDPSFIAFYYSYRNKDDYNSDIDNGGIWYMNPDGSGKTQVGQTRDGGESTG